MTLLRRGSIAKRVGALLCALALILHLAFVPLRARAFAGVLPAVAAGTVVTAFLMASGIYPYEEQAEFAEYVSDNLSSLWSQYLDWRTENSMDPPVTGNELSSLTGYLTQGAVAISRNVWNTLSEFVTWVIDRFSVTDNQTGANLGTFSETYYEIPTYSGTITASSIVLNGARNFDVFSTSSGSRSYSSYTLSTVSGTRGFSSLSSDEIYYFCSVLPLTEQQYKDSSFLPRINAYTYTHSSSYTNNVATKSSLVYDGQTYYYAYRSDGGFYFSRDLALQHGSPVYVSDWLLPFYDSLQQGILACLGLLDVPTSFSGVTADTTTVSPPAALPADTPWAGLAVEGAGTASTVGAVERVIQEGVVEREKPEVKVVGVELGANTGIDTDTGAVTENPIVVTPESVIPTTAELIAPDSFVGMAVNALQTKFPFCLPFDVVRILQAFIVPPSAPVINLTFHDPFTDKDYSITVDLSPWDEVAAVCRFMWSILLFVAFSLNVAKMFHIERGTGELFLGNVGSPGV